MRDKIDKLLTKKKFTQEEIVYLLSCYTDEVRRSKIHKKARLVKKESIGKNVSIRGLIEFSNKCRKNCLYCGIRSENTDIDRYCMSDEDITSAATFAHENNMGSVVIQTGERKNLDYIEKITNIIKECKSVSKGSLGITLSCGEQRPETYKQWFAAGAHRYLLRIETTNKELFYKIHPKDEYHNFEERIEALRSIKEAGYLTGTGVMIGLPYQTLEDLANDLLFFKAMDVDMVGMGPYLEHENTPLYAERDKLMELQDRFELSLLMISLLRIMMPHINIAASTALQAIDPCGREKGILAGANVIMPNITPLKYREGYLLYNNKPGTKETAQTYLRRLESNLANIGESILWGVRGDIKKP